MALFVRLSLGSRSANQIAQALLADLQNLENTKASFLFSRF